MKQKIVITLILLLLSAPCIVSAQDNVTPKSLEVKLYTDGTALLSYLVESDPSKVRVDVELFGETYNNLIIKDEEGLPLGSTIIPDGITVETIGASELYIIYTTSDLTSKIGPIWNLNLTSTIPTKIILPQGAAIFDLGDIPVDIGIINGAQYLEMPAGDVYVSFLLSFPNLREEAETAINEAEIHLKTLETQDYVLSDAREELAQAQQYYQNNQFLEAKNMANQAMETADKSVDMAKTAELEIALAETKINQARDDGRTMGLDQAEETLTSALVYYDQGLYIESTTAAKQASQLASSSKNSGSGNTLLYLVIIVVILGATGAYYYMNYRRVKNVQTEPTKVESDSKTIDLEKLFRKHDGLRLEDREVIKFLASNNGEAFATEIRDRFDMPRSTTWRLIRRLSKLEIIEEVKIGNQSLVRIKGGYHV